MHTTDDILRASAEWVWLPRDSEHENEMLRLVRYPARLGGGVRASQVDSTADAATVLEHAVARTRAWGESQLTVWTSASDSPDLEEVLREGGAQHVDTVAVFALAIDELAVDVPFDATAEVVRTLEQVRGRRDQRVRLGSVAARRGGAARRARGDIVDPRCRSGIPGARQARR